MRSAAYHDDLCDAEPVLRLQPVRHRREEASQVHTHEVLASLRGAEDPAERAEG